MKEALLNPTIYKPEVEGEKIDQFLRRIGIPISEDSAAVSFRITPNTMTYGFKTHLNIKAMSIFLIDNEIDFECQANPNGAVFCYHIILKK